MVKFLVQPGYLTLPRLADQVFGEPDPAIWVDVDADPGAMQGSAGQVDAVPAAGRLVNHAFLHRIDVGPGGSRWTGQPDAFAAIAIAREAFVSDAYALVKAIGAGMAEAAVMHVPAMQTRPVDQRLVPDERIEPARCPVAVHQIK
jgi:hypothetical protein